MIEEVDGLYWLSAGENFQGEDNRPLFFKQYATASIFSFVFFKLLGGNNVSGGANVV